MRTFTRRRSYRGTLESRHLVDGGPARAPRAARRDLGPQTHAVAARLGPARDDAPPRRGGAGERDRDARPRSRTSASSTTRSVAAREAAPVRGVARVRLRRREPDPRRPQGLGEGAARAAPSCAASGSRAASLAKGIWVDARASNDFASLPPRARAELRAAEALRGVLRVGRLAVHAAARRLRAVHDDDRGGGGLRRHPPGAPGDRPRRRRRSTPRSSRSRSTTTASASSRERMIATVGLDEDAWRLDTSAHPFCISFARQDVRMTTRFMDTGLRALWSSLHEAGHALYANGNAPSLERTLARRARRRSGSTSRRAGRGRTSSAAAAVLDALVRARSRSTFPDELGDVGLDAFMAAINRAAPDRAPRPGGRDDVQPPHHPALRPRAAA